MLLAVKTQGIEVGNDTFSVLVCSIGTCKKKKFPVLKAAQILCAVLPEMYLSSL